MKKADIVLRLEDILHTIKFKEGFNWDNPSREEGQKLITALLDIELGVKYLLEDLGEDV